MRPHDIELMQAADGDRTDEAIASDPAARAKLDALGELGELVRGHLEATADAVPEARFAAMWREIDGKLESPATESGPVAHGAGVWRRLARWLDHYRGYVITGAVSAGAVAALALVLRGGGDQRDTGSHAPIEPTAAAYRPTEIESLETPGGTGTVFNLKDVDDDGASTVIWVSPEDTVDGI